MLLNVRRVKLYFILFYFIYVSIVCNVHLSFGLEVRELVPGRSRNLSRTNVMHAGSHGH